MCEEKARPSVAVLYFESAGEDERSESIACGVSEDLMTRLGEVNGLSVASRHDVVGVRGRRPAASDMGACMGVEWVVRGRLAVGAGVVSVEMLLADTGAGRNTWREVYEEPESRVFELAPAAARGVTRALAVALSASEEQRLSKPITRDAKAYERHASGRERLTRRGRTQTEAAVRAFEDAVAADPGFAAAWESMAAASSGMYTYYDGTREWLARMTASARRALELDACLIEARFHLAVADLHRREYARARAGFEETLRKRPGCYEAVLWLGILYDMTGDLEGALARYHQSAKIKPCSVEPWLYINMTHRKRGDTPAATEAARSFLEVGLKMLRLVPDDPVTLSRLCVIYTLFDEKDKARETLRRILDTGTEDGLVLYNCAATYALLGDESECLGCLRKALAGGYKNVRDWIETDPDFDRVRGLSGYGRLLREFDERFEKAP